MNIQLSVSIWTVICFCLLMLILQNGVFKPVLRVLDSRKEKLATARAKKQEMLRLEQEHAELYEQQRAEYLQRKKEETKAAVDKIHSDEKIELKNAHAKSVDDIDAYRLEIEEACAAAIAGIRPKMKEAAGMFAQRIVSHRG